jgi:hypothetical protein
VCLVPSGSLCVWFPELIVDSWVSVRREKVQYFSRCNFYPAKVAPAGSYRSGGGGNKAVEAFEKNTPLGGVASKQAVMSCERCQGLEKSYAGADPSDTWGRPPLLVIGRPVGIGRATSDKSQRSRRGKGDGMLTNGELTQHEKPHVVSRVNSTGFP